MFAEKFQEFFAWNPTIYEFVVLRSLSEKFRQKAEMFSFNIPEVPMLDKQLGDTELSFATKVFAALSQGCSM